MYAAKHKDCDRTIQDLGFNLSPSCTHPVTAYYGGGGGVILRAIYI